MRCWVDSRTVLLVVVLSIVAGSLSEASPRPLSASPNAIPAGTTLRRIRVETLPAAAIDSGQWDISSLNVEGTLDIAADTRSVNVNLHSAHITGDLIIRTLPLSLDLADATVEGSVWVGDWPSHKEEVLFPSADTNHDKYPEDTEGCWDIRRTENARSKINIARIQARNFLLRYVHVHSLLAQHADVKDSVYLDHSAFDGEVNLGFLIATHTEFVGATFQAGLSLQSAQLTGLDLDCVKLGGMLEGLSAHVTGNAQLIGLIPVKGARPSIDFALGTFGGLALRGMNGEFEELNLSDVRIGLLDLDYEDRDRSAIDPSLLKPWHFERVITNGASLEIVRPSEEKRLGTGDRVGDFAEEAVKSDDRIYRKLAEAYGRDGDEGAANEAWDRYSGLAFLLHLPLMGALGISLGMIGLGGVVGGTRLKRFYGRRRVLPFLDGALLSIDLLLPGIIDLGITKRHEDYLKQVSGFEELAVVCYRVIGWVLIASLAAHIAFKAGR